MSPPRVPRVAVLATVALALGGCTREREQAHRDSAIAASPAVAAAQSQPTTMQTPPLGGGAVCPNWGKWEPCNIENRLARAGLSIKRTGAIPRYPFIHVPGIEYETTVAKIHVFIYPDQAARAADTDAIDPETASPREKPFYYKEPAILVTSINLAAIVITLNGRQAERIDNALGAGLPANPPAGARP